MECMDTPLGVCLCFIINMVGMACRRAWMAVDDGCAVLHRGHVPDVHEQYALPPDAPRYAGTASDAEV